jgi:hypothetical protein
MYIALTTVKVNNKKGFFCRITLDTWKRLGESKVKGIEKGDFMSLS